MVEFCVTKTTDVWEEAREFDMEVNYVDVYRTWFLIIYMRFCELVPYRRQV